MKSNVFSEMMVTEIREACRVNLTDLYSGLKVNRPCSALYVKLGGRTTYQNETGLYVCDPEHIVYLPEGCTYRVSFEVPGECYRIEFNAKSVDSGILSIPIKDNSAMLNLITRLERLWLFKKPSYLPKAMSVLYQIFAMLDELTNTSYVSSERYQLIAAGLKYLEDHYDDPALRLEQIAEAAGISEVYFRRLFKEIFHTSPVQYIRNVRIGKAKALLSGEYSTIEDVAYAVGFTNKYHFSKTFRQITGQTPSDFVESL